MTIKHLVIPGGGPSGIKALGALQYLEQNNFWNINNIETIYATSVGAILSVILCMKFDWETVNDYVIKRPWHEVFQIGVDQIFEAYTKKGLFDDTVTEIFYKPFFLAKDISLQVTLKEFYQLTNIELHLFSLDLNHFDVVDISYKTFPDLFVLKAVQMSAAIPILISPVCIDNKCFVDGGVVCNYPITHCIQRAENIDEIFGIRNKYEIYDSNIVKNESTILEYVMTFISKLIKNASMKTQHIVIPNELIYDVESMGLSNIKLALASQEIRKELLDFGIDAAKKFLKNTQNINGDKIDKEN